MNSPRHIAMFLPSLHIGGAERVTVSLANSLSKQGIRVDIVLLDPTGPLLEHIHQDIRVFKLNAKRIRNGFFPLIRYLRTQRPDIMFAHMYPLTSMAVFADALSGQRTKIVVVEHTNLINATKVAQNGAYNFKRWLIRNSYKRATHRVAVSKGAARALEEFSGLQPYSVEFIPNAVELAPTTSDEVANSNKMWPFGREVKRIISVGNLKSVKNFSYLLEAVALASQKADIQLMLVGDGPERGSLEDQAKELGISDRVVFAGFQSNPAPFLQSSDLFALSSLLEGLPTVIIEALACGLKVVSTDCKSGPSEILCPIDQPAYGTLVPLDDASEFAREILNLLDSSVDSKRQCERAEYFSPDNISQMYLAPFRKQSQTNTHK